MLGVAQGSLVHYEWPLSCLFICRDVALGYTCVLKWKANLLPSQASLLTIWWLKCGSNWPSWVFIFYICNKLISSHSIQDIYLLVFDHFSFLAFWIKTLFVSPPFYCTKWVKNDPHSISRLFHVWRSICMIYFWNKLFYHLAFQICSKYLVFV